MLDFDGQVVIVTGSGSPKGIGRTIARTFARQKAAVVIADMNEAGVKDTVAAIKEEGGEAFGVVVNITDEASVQNMVDQVMQQAVKLIQSVVMSVSEKIATELQRKQ